MYFLSIETATDVCCVAIHDAQQVIDNMVYLEANMHGNILNQLIEDILFKNKINIKEISAIAIGEGPGSYTGMRIGMSVAKGLCYALDIPLIGISTLETMIRQVEKNIALLEKYELIIASVDARRDQVFALAINNQIELFNKFIVLNDYDFSIFDNFTTIHLIGSGASKWHNYLHNKNIILHTEVMNASAMHESLMKKWGIKNFVDLAYAEPNYMKEAYVNVGAIS